MDGITILFVEFIGQFLFVFSFFLGGGEGRGRGWMDPLSINIASPLKWMQQ